MARKSIWLGLSISLIAMTAAASAEDSETPASGPTFREDGTVEVPAFELPPSDFMSEQAVGMLKMRAGPPREMPKDQNPDIETRRAQIDGMMAMPVAMMQQKYAVDMQESRIADVPVRIFTPADGEYDKDRVLINVHGGGFTVCWDSCSKLESIPVAAVGDYKVVSVDYRMGPEAKHPAAVEDTVAVYTELLKEYDASHIGLYGCSAGGSLTSQTTSWLVQNDRETPGAIGIFGSGAVRFGTGDSAYLAAYVDGSFPAPGSPLSKMDITRGYFDGADMEGSLLSAANHTEILAKFPPTMLITGTRAMDMSPAIYTNSQLLKAGVDSTLIVGEGLGHCYLYYEMLPESQDAYQAIAAFFRENLQ